MKPTTTGVKEEAVVPPPESSSIVTSTVEASQTLKKGPWSAAEDAILMEYVKKHGEGNWNAVQKNIGLQRCGKSCRLRWANHLRPDLKKGSITPEEENLILQLHSQLGNKWARMAAQLPGRTDNEIKNYWNTRIKRRQRAGLPLYPPEIQHKIATIKQRPGFMVFPSQAGSKNFTSHLFPTTNTSFNSVGTNNYETNYFLGNFDLQSRQPQHHHHQQQQQHQQYQQQQEQHQAFIPLRGIDGSRQPQPHNFSVKMEHPSNQLYYNCVGHQKLPPQLRPQGMGQANDALYTDLPQEAQRPLGLFNEPVVVQQFPTNCTNTLEPLPQLMPPPPSSSTKRLSIDPLSRLGEPDFSIGLSAIKHPIETMVNQNISNPVGMNPIQTSGLTTGNFDDWFGQTPDDVQAFDPNFSMPNDWNFESGPWEP